MTRLEKAARALCLKTWPDLAGEELNEAVESEWGEFVEEVRIVLRLLRIPDDQLNSGNEILRRARMEKVVEADLLPGPADVGFWFNAVLDALLAEGSR